MELRLSGKVSVVMAGSRGLGKASTRLLAEKGADPASGSSLSGTTIHIDGAQMASTV